MKKNLGRVNGLYPLPTTLVGTLVDGRPNFTTIAHVGVLTVGEPECISLGMHKSHYGNEGIRQKRTFSVCIPPRALVAETDYCGLVTGKSTDKSELFEVFYGELETAPMIGQCPVCMECRLHQTVDFPAHDIFVGEIVATHADEEVLTDGRLDIGKIDPLLFDMASKRYWTLGPDIADCWHEGLKLKRRVG